MYEYFKSIYYILKIVFHEEGIHVYTEPPQNFLQREINLK